MGTEKDFKVKKGLTVTDNISVSGDIDVSSLYGRLNFKKNADGNVNNDAIFFINGSDQYAGAVKYFHSTNTLRFDANQATQLHIADGSIYPPVDNDVDLGTSSLKFKDSFFGLVDAENFKINGGQGSDGQVLTSTGSGVAWEDAASGGASVIGDLTDVLMDATNFVDGILIQTNSDGSAPTTGTLSNATGNTGIGKSTFTALTSGTENTAYGYDTLPAVTSGSRNTAIGYEAGKAITNSMFNTLIGYGAGKAVTDSSGGHNTAMGYESGKSITTGPYNVLYGKRTGMSITTGSRNIAIGNDALDNADTESDNIAIGYNSLGGAVAGGAQNLAIGNYSLDAAVTGSGNIALGHSAGSAATSAANSVIMGYEAVSTGVLTGARNVAIGYQTMRNATSGADNTFVGAEVVGNGVLTGSNNVGVGRGVLKDATSADGNTALGYNSMAELTTGDNNTAIGTESMDTGVVTGAKNIALGWRAGNNLTSGSNNVVIGAVDVTADADNQLSISSGDGGTTWITGDSDGGLVLGKEGAGVVQVGNSSLNPSGINLGKFIVSRDDATSPIGPTMSLIDGDDDGNTGPILKMYRNTASPADGDLLGAITFNGEDSVGGERNYARIVAVSDDVTSGSNDGSLEFRVFANGTQTEVMQLEPDAQAGAKMTLMGVSQTGAVVSGASTANNAYLNLLTVAHGTHKAITASVHITDSTNNEVQTEMIVAHYDG